jgi:hypothetical protein
MRSRGRAPGPKRVWSRTRHGRSPVDVAVPVVPVPFLAKSELEHQIVRVIIVVNSILTLNTVYKVLFICYCSDESDPFI